MLGQCIPREFFGYMKDEIDLNGCKKYREVKAVIDDWIEYCNNERYQWQLAKLSPNEYYKYITTGIYPFIMYPIRWTRQAKGIA